MPTPKTLQLQGSPIRSYLMVLAAALLLLQALLGSKEMFSVLTMVALSAFLFVLYRSRPELLLFWVVPVLYLITVWQDGQTDGPVLADIFLLTFFILWFWEHRRRVDVREAPDGVNWFRFLFFAVFAAFLIRYLLQPSEAIAIRGIRNFFLGYFFLLFFNSLPRTAGDYYAGFARSIWLTAGVLSIVLIGILAVQGVAPKTVAALRFVSGTRAEGAVFFLTIALPVVFLERGNSSTSPLRKLTPLLLPFSLLSICLHKYGEGLLALAVVSLGVLLLNRERFRANMALRVAGLGLLISLFLMAPFYLLQQSLFDSNRIEFLRWPALFCEHCLWQVWQSPLWGHGPTQQSLSLFWQIAVYSGFVAFLLWLMFLWETLKSAFQKGNAFGFFSQHSGLAWAVLALIITSLWSFQTFVEAGFLIWFALLYLNFLLRARA